jgi:hypothetical protein
MRHSCVCPECRREPCRDNADGIYTLLVFQTIQSIAFYADELHVDSRVIHVPSGSTRCRLHRSLARYFDQMDAPAK